MASAINIKVTSNFDEASKMLREFGNTTEAQKAKVQAFVDSFKTEKVDQFMDKNTRAAAAVRATQGPMQALTTEHRNLQREIERLIRNGLDPQDEALKPLIQRYQQLEKELEDNARAQKSTEKVSAITAASFLYIAKTAVNAAKQVFAFGKDLVDAYGIQEQAEKALSVAIEATGRQSDISMDAMTRYASALQSATLYGDEQILSAQGVLQSLADLDQQGLQTVTPAVMDFATAMGVDLQTAMSLVGKTLGSSTNALSRYGITIDMTGSKEEKLAELTEQLHGKFAGAAQAAAETSTGSFKQFSNALGDVKEAMGATIAEGAEPFARAMTDYAARLAESINNTRELKNIMDDLKEGTVGGTEEIDRYRESLEFVNQKLEELNRVRGVKNYAKIEQYEEEKKLLEERLIVLENLRGQELRQQDYAEAALRSIEEERAAQATAAAEAAKWTDERIRQQESLKDAFAQIEEQEKLFGDAFDDRAAKETAVRKALQEMIAFGFTAEGDGIRRVMDEYGVYLEQLETVAGEKERLTWDEIQSYLDKNSYAEAWHDAEIARINEEIEAAEELAEKRKKATEDMYSSLTGAADAYFDYRLSLYDKDSEEYKEIQIKQFNWDKATSAIETGIHGATAAVRAFADLGWPAGAIAAAVVGGLTAAKVGFILAQQPPSFQTGTLPSGFTVPESASSRGDSQLVRVSPGEHVDVTPRGGGSTRQNISIKLGEDTLIDFINDKISSGEIRVGVNL